MEGTTPKEQTSLTLTVEGSPAMTGGGDFSGNLTPALAGAKIRIVYKRTTAPTSTTTHTVTVNSQGGYRDHFDFSGQYPSHWQVQAFFDGDNAHQPSQSQAVEFDIGD